MLWAGLFIACTLALFLRLPAWRTILAVLGAFAAIIAGNALRAAALFYPEAGIVPALPPWLHTGVGLIVFFGVALLIAWWTHRLARKLPEHTDALTEPSAISPGWMLIAAGIAVVAAVLPFRQPLPSQHAAQPFPGWSAPLAGYHTIEVPLTARERRFAEDFPGRIGRFSDGQHEFIIRWITRETRMLHPAADCFRATGYRVSNQSPRVGNDGRQWGAFTASKPGEPAMQVREIITDGAGHSWSDVSSWYWSATLGRSAGPWWATTVITRKS
jgi:exosortase/archaeosortase family protein